LTKRTVPGRNPHRLHLLFHLTPNIWGLAEARKWRRPVSPKAAARRLTEPQGPPPPVDRTHRTRPQPRTASTSSIFPQISRGFRAPGIGGGSENSPQGCFPAGWSGGPFSARKAAGARGSAPVLRRASQPPAAAL